MSASQMHVTKTQVLALAPATRELKKVIAKVTGYNNKVASMAIKSLLDPKTAVNAWQMFMAGVKFHANTIPVGDKRLSDYPQLIEDILGSNGPKFFTWLMLNVSNEEMVSQAIMRNLFHFVEFTFRIGGGLDQKELKRMEKEFEAMNVTGNTVWLSRIFNGLQTSFIEAYMIQKYGPKYLFN
ncbi:MAG: hypothetical protein ACOZAO_00825 [Patescibacteria group bacterium]